jgi:hypothetical protein
LAFSLHSPKNLEKFADYEDFSADINGTVILVLFTQSSSSLPEEVVNMLGKTAYLGFLGLLALSCGCTMCCHPYDNNGPVYDSSGQCVSNIRAGSILADGEMQPMVEDQGIIQETSSNVQHGSPRTEEVEGATQILSVTDRKVEPSDTMEKSQPEAYRSRPVLAQPTPAMRR